MKNHGSNECVDGTYSNNGITIKKLLGPGRPIETLHTPVGSEYTDVDIGEKWLLTKSGWKRLAFVN